MGSAEAEAARTRWIEGGTAPVRRAWQSSHTRLGTKAPVGEETARSGRGTLEGGITNGMREVSSNGRVLLLQDWQKTPPHLRQ